MLGTCVFASDFNSYLRLTWAYFTDLVKAETVLVLEEARSLAEAFGR
jgi:hypothetical protein